jgi:aspartate/methionine/tyrosine aminotransferase
MSETPPAPQRLSRPLAKRTEALTARAEWSPHAPPVSDAVIAAAMAALQRGETHYTDRPGILPLREQVAHALTSHYGISMTPKDVTITCGAMEARFVALRLLATPGSAVACLGTPTLVQSVVQLVGAQPVQFLGQSTYPTSVIYVTPQTDFEMHGAWLDFALSERCWVIWDTSNGYGDAKVHPAQFADLATRVVTIGSLSHALPGWRVGWMAGSEMAEKLRSFKQSLTICTTSVSQWAAAEWMRGQHDDPKQ